MFLNQKIIKKILIIGDFFPDSLEDNIFSTLKNMEYTVNVLPYSPFTNTKKPYLRILGTYITRVSPRLEDFFSGKLIRKAIRFQPDLVIALHSGIPPQAIEKIKKETNAIIICWFTDSVANLNRQYLLGSPYDMLFLKEPYMVELFRNKLHKSIFYLPEAFNPLWHKKVDLTDEERKYYGCDIAHVGNMYYYRALILEQLIDYQIKIWGPIFPRWLNSPLRGMFMEKYIAREEKAKAFRAAKINLNTLHPSEIYGINCRAFEIAGCGGFQIAEYRPALREIFELDREIVTFETIKELKEKVAYYLFHSNEREEIALRSFERAHREHTYEQRLRVIMEAVNEFIEGKL